MVAASAASSSTGFTLDPEGEKWAALMWKTHIKGVIISEMRYFYVSQESMTVKSSACKQRLM